jgi:exonuclease SbcC
VTLVLGANGAGKSSLAAAIEYALTGSCEWTDRGGRGFAELIGHEASQANIDLAMDNGLAVMRTLTPKGARVGVNEHAGDKASAMLELRLPAVSLLRCMLRSDEFIGLPSKEQADLLFRLSGAEPDAAWVRKRLTEQEAKALDQALSVRLTGSALLKHLDTAARELRKEANAEAKGAKAALGEQPERAADGRTADNARAELANARKGLEELQRRAGASSEKHRAHEEALRRNAEAALAVGRAQAAVSELGEQPVTDPEGFERMATERANITRETTRLIEERASVKGEASALQRQVAAYVDAGGACPLGILQCPVDEGQRAQAVADAQTRVEHLGQLAAELDQKVTLHQREGAKVDEAMKQAQAASHAAAEWERKRTGYAAVLAEAEAASERAAEHLDANPEPDDEATDAGLEEARALVARLEGTIRDAEAAERSADLAKRVEALDARAAMLDGLVKKLAPDGLPEQAMAETVGVVLADVNAALEEFTDFMLVMGSDGDMGVARTSDDTGVVTKVSHLSESEKLRVGAAIQVAFARLTEFGFVVVDAADRLDGSNRGPLLGMLLNSDVQALVLSTPMNGKRPTGIDGLAVYDLQDGAIVEAAQEVAA